MYRSGTWAFDGTPGGGLARHEDRPPRAATRTQDAQAWHRLLTRLEQCIHVKQSFFDSSADHSTLLLSLAAKRCPELSTTAIPIVQRSSRDLSHVLKAY
jgi:hypothetical protein